MNLDISSVKNLPPEKMRELLDLLQELEDTRRIESARENFMPFVRHVWPDFIEGRHHKIMADAFDRVASGKLKRLIINMPPRHTKSEFASYLLPAWFLGRFPKKKIIQASHTADLAVGFGRKVRNLVDSERYNEVFKNTILATDSKASGRWNTSMGGDYYAIGVGGAVTGKGADLFIIDDPHSEQDAISGDASPDVYKKAFEWYITGPRQRLQPGAAIVIVMTRWSALDLTGQLIRKSSNGDINTSEWEVIEFPALLPSGNPLWPEFWSKEELQKVKADISPSRWSAQYQQNPTADDSAIIKREWWKRWNQSLPPKVDFIITSWDTAFLKTERANYSACTTWGVFQGGDPDKPVPQLMLLDAWRDRLEFPELKKAAKAHYMKWRPDMNIIETRAAGAPLIFELRAMGIPVNEFTPSRGNDKIARANSVADIFRSGMVWAPEMRWADDVIEECAAFPNGENDDFVDTVTQALIKYRQGGMIRSDNDEVEKKNPTYRRVVEYY